MKLTRVQFCTHVASPSAEVRGPRGLLMVQEPDKPPNSSKCRSLELVSTPLPGVIIDGERFVPLSNVASCDPPPKVRVRRSAAVSRPEQESPSDASN